jgi:hypothetical protein
MKIASPKSRDRLLFLLAMTITPGVVTLNLFQGLPVEKMLKQVQHDAMEIEYIL